MISKKDLLDRLVRLERQVDELERVSTKVYRHTPHGYPEVYTVTQVLDMLLTYLNLELQTTHQQTTRKLVRKFT